MAARKISRAFLKNTRVNFTSRVFPGDEDNQITDNTNFLCEIHIILKEKTKISK